MHEGATCCGRGSGDTGLRAGGFASDTPLGLIYFRDRHLRIIAGADIEKRKESGRSVFVEQRVRMPWVKGDR